RTPDPTPSEVAASEQLGAELRWARWSGRQIIAMIAKLTAEIEPVERRGQPHCGVQRPAAVAAADEVRFRMRRDHRTADFQRRIERHPGIAHGFRILPTQMKVVCNKGFGINV